MPDANRQLLVMPDDGLEPIVRAVESARHSLAIKIFLFTEPILIAAVIAAHRRGVRTRVMLNPARRSGESENVETHAALADAGVAVKETNPDFAVTHEKSMVIDGEMALINSLNWTPKNFTETRDYAVVTTHQPEVDEVLSCFDADWERAAFDARQAQLIWCPNNGREQFARFIDEARESLWLQNERYQDMTIVERLVRAKMRGVQVRVLSLPPHILKKRKLVEGVNGLRIMHDVGIKVHKLKGLHLHAKMLIADDKSAIVGSINIAPGSFDDRRELAIELHDRGVVKHLRQVFKTDWENSRRLDLSDDGIRKDLQKHRLEDGGSLALGESGQADRKKGEKGR